MNFVSKIVKIDRFKLLLFGYKLNKSIKKHNNINKKLRVIYNVHNSLPETNNGYAMRTHSISKSALSVNINFLVVTRSAFPLDFNFLKKFHNDKNVYIVDGVKYYRLKKNALFIGKTTLTKYLNNYSKLLTEFTKKQEALIIHSASNYINGLAGINSANSLGIPSIYEVRGFWEITKASREPKFKNTLGYKLEKKLEIKACMEATSVIALSEVVKEELLDRGIDKSKIFVVPNGVDTDTLKPITEDIIILEKYNLKDKFTVGFIGSVVDYEGLQLLVEAAKIIDKKYQNKFRYLIVGDGNSLENLKKLVKELDLEKLFIFTGRVPYEEVEAYYSVSDIFCYPRLDWEVCRIVSPKKPFEAMAYGKPIISSSVRANSYFIEHGNNGLIHEKEDVDSIVENILSLYENKELYNKISKNAREWVVKNRDSKMTGKLLKDIYIKTQEKFYNS